MSGSRYIVLQFLELPNNGMDKFVCVPEPWQQRQDPDGRVAVAYPLEEPEVTGKRVSNYEDYSKTWNIYMANVLDTADSYEDALLKIDSLGKSKCSIPEIKKLGAILDNMKIENTNHKELANKQSSDMTCTPKPNNTKKETVKARAKTHAEKNTPRASTSKNTLSIAPNNAETGANESENIKTKNVKKEVNKVPHNKPRLSRSYEIPENFDPNDLSHMFRHLKPIPGKVVELLPNTKVYIEASILETKFKNYTEMARTLMKEIFTDRALQNCTLSGEPPIAKNHLDSATRPPIDQDGREAIIQYVYDNCYKDWKEGRNSIEYAMRKELKPKTTNAKPKQ